MSDYYICGEVRLPQSEVAVVRRLYRQTHNNYNAKIYAKAKDFRKKYGTKSEKRWRQSLQNGMENAEKHEFGSVLVALRIYEKMGYNRAFKHSDFNGTPYAEKSVKDNDFPIFANNGDVIGKVWFNDRIVKWCVDGDRINEFNESVYSGFMHKVFKKIDWNRGSGGGETIYAEGMTEPAVKYTYGPEGTKYTPVTDVEVFMVI